MDQVIIWPAWKKIIFRYFFVYLLLFIEPWTWIEYIPGADHLTDWYHRLMDWAVHFSNSNVFHVKKELVPLNGSGDTSYGWAALWLGLSVALIGCITWSILDRKRKHYQQLNYWLCIFTRYNIVLIAFSYGILKLFCLQMGFPTTSQLDTPLGDLLPMRFSWLFIGYSQPYQIFSGFMEVLAGILLLYRRTATLGTFLAFIIFTNVMILNLSYDIPVKIYSMQIVLLCLFLLVNEWNRMVCFFILNKPASICDIYHFRYIKRWMRLARFALKTAFVFAAIWFPLKSTLKFYKMVHTDTALFPLPKGMYDVKIFALNKDTLPPLLTDTLRWQDIIFDKGGQGSIATHDTSFRRRYNRAYFNYLTDTVRHTIQFNKTGDNSLPLILFSYTIPDSFTLQLRGKKDNDSLYVELNRSKRYFQLAEKQFHWLSEQNR